MARGPGRAPGRFYRAGLTVLPEGEEAAVAAFWDAGCVGVEVISIARRRGAPRLHLRAYFAGRSAPTTVARRLRGALVAGGLAGLRPPALRPVRDRGWVEAWQRSLRPMAIGRRFLVVPEGCRVPMAAGRTVIRVRFGRAFGTGEHASTRLCLRLMERHLKPGARVIDLGTGSGILAIAACRMGAARVTAVDHDPAVLDVARANLADNRLPGAVRVLRGDAAGALRTGPFDLALVNIGATTIARLLPDLARALAPGGGAILAGLLVDDEAALVTRARALGLVCGARLRSRPWSALVLRRPAGRHR